MGLAAEILWSNSRSDRVTRAAIGDPAEVTGNFSEGLAAINLRWLLVMFRVGTLMIALFQAAYILQIVYFANIPATVREPAVLGIDLLIAALPCLAFALSFSSPATARRPLRILLAEDSPDNRLLIAAYFKRLPYQVETAEDGKVAVEKFTSGRYDLVLMDIQMPVMDGYTAVRTIRAWETEHRRPATPILALTASTLDEDIPRAFEAGCNAHIAKPVRKATLLAAIDETLARVAAGMITPVPAASAAPAAPTAPLPAHARVHGVQH